MARPAGQARPNPTEATRQSLTGPGVGVVGELPFGLFLPRWWSGLVLESIHSRFGDGPGRAVAKSGVRPRQGRLNDDGVSRAAVSVFLLDRPDGARDPALGEDEPQFSIVGENHPAGDRPSTALCRGGGCRHRVIAFVADPSRVTGDPHDPDIASPLVGPSVRPGDESDHRMTRFPR